MKKLILAAGLMLAVSALTGCQREEKPAVGELRSQTLTIVSSPAQTRTIMEGDKVAGFNTAWTPESDMLGVYSHNPDVPSYMYTTNTEFRITSVNNGSATFQGEIKYDTVDREYDLYAYYPRYAGLGYSGQYNLVTLPLYSTQTMPAAGTYDPACDYMVSLPGPRVSVEAGKINVSVIDDFEFRYLVGFMNLTISDILEDSDVSPTDIVKSVQISAKYADGNPLIIGGSPILTGTFQLDLSTGEQNFTSMSYSVNVNCPAETTLADLDMWAVVNPFTLDDPDDTLTFTITTETHYIEKTVTVAELTGGNEFAIGAGGIKTFDMAVDENCNIRSKGLDLGLMSGISLFQHTEGYSVDTWAIRAYQRPGITLENGVLKGNGWYCEFTAYPPTGYGPNLPDGEYTINTAQTEWTAYAMFRGNGSSVKRLENDVTVETRFFQSGTVTSSYSKGTYNINIDATITGTTGPENMTLTIMGTAPAAAPVN